MIKIALQASVIVMLSACSKEVIKTDDLPQPPRVATDSLMIYQSSNASGNRGIFSKSFTTGDSVLLVANATAPYVASQRMVYIKAGKTLGYSRLNGISKFLIDLNEPATPCLSVDTRLIGVIDKSEDQYQLLVLDTLENKTLLYQSALEIKEPEFSTDGKLVYFSQKTTEGRFTIYSISSLGGTPLQLLEPLPDADYTDCAATSERLYFLQTRTVSGKLSTEICSVNFTGSDFKKQTDFTLNWTQYGFKIENLRKVNSSTLIFVSEYGSTNKEIYVAKADNLSNHTRMTYSDSYESCPSLVPDFVPDF
jgi:hypothetical protein